MGYPTKIQLITRKKGNQWYVNFPAALAESMNFEKSETVEWEVESLQVLKMVRRTKTPVRKENPVKKGAR